MKKILISMALVALGFSANAQSSNFLGLSAAINLNSASTTTKLFTTDTSFASGINGFGQQSWGASLQTSYGFEINPKVVLSTGISYSLNKLKAGDFLLGENAVASAHVKNALSLYFEPGYRVSDSTLVYGKLSYERAKADLVSSEEAAINLSKSINGVGFGAGVRTMLNKSTFIQVEFKQIGYNKVTLDQELTIVNTYLKRSTTMGSVGIGIAF